MNLGPVPPGCAATGRVVAIERRTWLFSLDIRTTSKWTVGPVAPDKELKESTWPPIMAKNSNVFTEWLFGLVGNQIKHDQHPITWLRLPQG